MTWEHFEKPAIVECVVDLRVTPNVPLDDIIRFAQSVASDYPVQAQMWRNETTVQLDPSGPATSTAREHVGMKLTSPDKSQVAQGGVDGFAFNRLAPYDSWSQLCESARRVWGHFTSEAHPDSVCRIGLRTINRIEIPANAEVEQYVTLGPKIPDQLPQALQGCHLRVTMQKGQTLAILTHRWESPAVNSDARALSIVFDIDVFRLVSLPAASEEIWKELEELHDERNTFFFGSITEKAKELLR